MFKGTVDVITSFPPLKEGNARFPTYPLNLFLNKHDGNIIIFLF